jgi:hypothetical protein
LGGSSISPARVACSPRVITNSWWRFALGTAYCARRPMRVWPMAGASPLTSTSTTRSSAEST